MLGLGGVILILSFQEAAAQRIVFGYDAAGNRISRQLETPGGRQVVVEEEDSVIAELLQDVTEELVIYPNATERFLYVRTLKKAYPYQLHIFDLNGRVFFRDIIEQDGVMRFDLADLAVGMYMIRMSGKTEERSFRILKHN